MAQNNDTTVGLYINGKQAEKTLAILQKEAENLGKQLEEAVRRGDKAAQKELNKSLKDVNQTIKQVQSSTKNVADVMARLDKATPHELRKTLTTLNNQLKHIERGSSAWNEHVAKIQLVKAELDKVNAEMKQSESLLVRMRNGIQNWGAMAAGAVAAFSGVVMAGKKAVNTYAEMQQEEANVRKYTGMTEEEVNHLNDAFKKMDTRTSREELNKLAQEAGRLGLQSEEDVLGFVKAADKINVALDDLGDGATLTLSKLTDIFGDKQALGTERSLLAVGSVINELSQNSTAAAPYLAEFAQRLAGVGAQAHMTIPEIMGFGAVLDSQGQKLEMSSTALSKVIMNLFKNPEKIAKATGLAVEEFSETCKRSTNEGLLMLLERLHELGGIDSLAPVFADMGENGARASAVLAALAGNVDMVRQQQEAANVAFSEAVSIDKEFNVQNTTVQAGLEKARKGFTEMAVTLGKELMPIVTKVISSTSMTMRVLLKVIQFVKEYRVAILTATAALVTYYAAVKAQEAWNAFTSGIKKAVVAVRAFNAALAANPLGAVLAVLAAVGTAIAVFVHRAREAAKEMDVIGRANQQAAKSFAEQKAKVDQLTAAVNNNNLSLEYRRKALKELQAIVPGYHASLTDEGKLINDNRDAINDYLTALDRKLKMQAYEEMLQEQYRKKAQAELQKDEATAELDGYEYMYRAGAETDHDKDWNALSRSEKKAKGKAFSNQVAANKDIEEANAQIDKLQKKMAEIPPVVPVTVEVETKTVTPDNSTPTPAAEKEDPEKALKEKLQKLEDAKKKEMAINQVAYLQGEKDYEAYTTAQIQAEVNFNRQKMSLYQKGSTEYLEAQAAMLAAEKKLQDQQTGQTVEAEQKRYAEVKAVLDQRYADSELSAKAYQLATEQAELEHLKNLANTYEEGSKERLKAEELYQQRSTAIQQKHAADAKRIQEQLQKEYFSNVGMTTNTESYEEEKLQLEAVRQIMMAQATAEQKLQIEEAYQKARYELAKKYHDEEGMYAVDSAQASVDKVLEYMKSDGFQGFYQSFQTLVSGMGEIFSGLSDLIDAEVTLQEQKINKKYEAEIAAAGNNKDRVAQIEAEKEKEIAAMKNEAEEKKYGMQIASTIAQTAIAAVNAYSSAAAIPVVGWIMGPIAAAMAVAAGGIQLATLKKQHEAAMSQGYAAGGYTAPGSKYQPAGIVHAGEWVASQDLLANPTAAATIAQLDQAQRTNTIGQLSKPSPSASVSSSERISSPTEAHQPSNGSASVGESLDRLNKTLDGGIYAATLMTGDKGILRQQRKHEQLMKNKSAK